MSNYKNCFWFFLFFNLSINAQKNSICLTATNKYGDCVSSGIFSSKTAFEIKIDQKKCELQNAGNPEACALCKKNVSGNQEVCSVIGYCGDGNNYIGINGKTYLMKRMGKVPKKYPYLTGDFVAKGFKIGIERTKLIEKEFFDDSSSKEENIMTYSYEVLITIKKGSKIRKVKAIAREGI
jgi:hypothetical protein